METEIIVGQIYKSLWEAIKELDVKDKAEMYDAIFYYQFVGEMPKFTNKLLFGFFKSHLPILDKFIKNQKNRIEANRQNGKLGGRPKTETKPNESEQNPQKPKETHKNPSVILDNPKKPTKTLINNNKINNNNINNKRENNIKEKSLAVVETTAQTPQVEVFNYFAKLYKSETNIDYLGKGIDYINLAKLIKKYGKALVIQKINWLLVGCKNNVFFFSKDMTDFNVSTLTAQWDRILPKLTAEQKKEQDKLKQEQEKKKKLYEALAKQGIVLEEKGNKGGLSVISR